MVFMDEFVTGSCVLEGFTITGDRRGVYCNVSSPLIRNCVIKDCGDVSSYYDGVYLLNNSDPKISNCFIVGNRMRGVYVTSSSSEPEIVNCVIYDNGDDGIYLSQYTHQLNVYRNETNKNVSDFRIHGKQNFLTAYAIKKALKFQGFFSGWDIYSTGLTSVACGPLRPSPISYSTFAPSLRDRNPSAMMLD